MVRFFREKRLLTFVITRVAEGRYAPLLLRAQVLQLRLMNLRNRPLTKTHLKSMHMTIPGLYHSLATGSKDFPVIKCQGAFLSSVFETPFHTSEESQMENGHSPLLFAPAGLMVPKAGPGAPSPKILMPVHPEKADLGALRADKRNCVREMEIDGNSFTRVISTVYRTNLTELNNYWRVSDYDADGHISMSAFCHFTGGCMQTLPEGRRRERDGDEESSSQSPPKKRLRL